jgi:hypothetical protein
MVSRQLFGIPAANAPIVAVIGRGPSPWASIGRWDVDAMTYEAGARLHARIYPQRCDLSPDGQYLCYFTLNNGSGWAAGQTYAAVSRLPWLFALAAWNEGTTYSRGMCFVDQASAEVPPPTVGAIDALPFGIAYGRADSFAVERRRGWREAKSTPPRPADDVWDQCRGAAIEMIKPNPRTDLLLRVGGGPVAAFRFGAWNEETRPRYSLEFANGQCEALDDVQWADWSADGRLLVATVGGELQIRDGHSVLWRYDTANDPSRRVAPPSARAW